jgi:integrase
MVVSWSMFTSKDITKAKALKFPQKHKVSMIEAVRNKDGSLSFIFRKKISKVARKSPVGLLIEKYYMDKDVDMEAINGTAIEWATLCNKGINPKDHLEQLAEEEEKQKAIEISNARTFSEAVEEYNTVMLRNGKNGDTTVTERMKVLKNVSGEWFSMPYQSIDYDKAYELFNIKAYQEGALGYAKAWGRNCQAIFNRGVKKGWIEVNPFIELAEDVGGFASGTSENNYLLVNEAVYISKKMDKFDKLDRKYGRGNQLQALKLLLYTGVRLNEVLKLKWENVHLNEKQPYIFFPKGTRKQKDLEFVIPILSKMKAIFEEQKKVEINDYVFPSYKDKTSHITDIDFALEILRPPSLDTEENKTVGNKQRVEKFTAFTLRRTWGQIGLDLGFNMSTLNFVTGRTKSIDSQGTAYKSYVSRGLNNALPFYKQIIDVIEGKQKIEDKNKKDQPVQPTAEVVKEVVADLHQTQEDKELLKKQDDNVIQKLLDLNMNLGRRRILIADAPEDVKKQHRELEEQVEFAEYRNKIREGDPNAEELKAILKSYNQPLP